MSTESAEPRATYAEAAARYGISVRKLQMMVRNGEIPFYRLGPTVRFDLKELDRALHNVPGPR